MTQKNRISIAILALGGQGGGVLADWILGAGRRAGYAVQGTSVPGVAQRTGTTVYYIEMAPKDDAPPVLALMPTAGDVDIVIAAELMEIGRAILRGFVTKDRTTVIGSSHRIYTIAEKSALGNGVVDSQRIMEKADSRSKHLVCFDMEAAADQAGCMISAILFGALAGSGAMPFSRRLFEEEIEAAGVAVAANMRGFAHGFDSSSASRALPEVDEMRREPHPISAAAQRLDARIRAELPNAAWALARHGIARLLDYQDEAYANLYLDRLASVKALLGRDPEGVIPALARRLALWMSYEDSIRVADLKTRRSRFERIRAEVKAKAPDLVGVTEFMHPRIEEICDLLPPKIGAFVLHSRHLRAVFGILFKKGRHVETTSVRWFLTLWLLARLRGMRRGTLRYAEEQRRIEHWLSLVRAAAASDARVAFEVVECQQLVKGYSDTFERGLRNFAIVTNILSRLPSSPMLPIVLRDARAAALKDESGAALNKFMTELSDVGTGSLKQVS